MTDHNKNISDIIREAAQNDPRLAEMARLVTETMEQTQAETMRLRNETMDQLIHNDTNAVIDEWLQTTETLKGVGLTKISVAFAAFQTLLGGALINHMGIGPALDKRICRECVPRHDHITMETALKMLRPLTDAALKTIPSEDELRCMGMNKIPEKAKSEEARFQGLFASFSTLFVNIANMFDAFEQAFKNEESSPHAHDEDSGPVERTGMEDQQG